MSRATITGVLAWLVAVVGATTIGLLAVGAIGDGIAGPGDRTLGPAEVESRLAAPPHPGHAPEPPAPLGDRPEVLASQGGTVLVRCVGGVPEIMSVTPAQGYSSHDAGRDDDDDGDSRRDRVRFEADDVKVQMLLSCASGRPTHTVTVADD
ncbi:hypothetical protein WEH80_00940 [Actinomycetes bacterium KLBMP 9759]